MSVRTGTVPTDLHGPAEEACPETRTPVRLHAVPRVATRSCGHMEWPPSVCFTRTAPCMPPMISPCTRPCPPAGPNGPAEEARPETRTRHPSSSPHGSKGGYPIMWSHGVAPKRLFHSHGTMHAPTVFRHPTSVSGPRTAFSRFKSAASGLQMVVSELKATILCFEATVWRPKANISGTWNNCFGIRNERIRT